MSSKRLQPNYLLLGEILRPHGVKGELRVRVLTDYPERLSANQTVYLGSDPMQRNASLYTVQSTRFHKQYLLLTLQGVQSRNDAEPLRGQYLMVDLEHAVPLEEDEFYFYELIGLAVESVDGDHLGTIEDVIETGANDVYVVRGTKFGEVLIPAHQETIISIDFDTETIVVNLPDGLLSS